MILPPMSDKRQTEQEIEIRPRRTIVNAALDDLILGLGFSILGAGGGRAAICGAAASGEREGEDGTTVGGEFASGEWG